jgi:hypothetical protein
MTQVFLEKNPKCSNGKFFNKESTSKCYFCRALFPIEYDECPNCNMLK